MWHDPDYLDGNWVPSRAKGTMKTGSWRFFSPFVSFPLSIRSGLELPLPGTPLPFPGWPHTDASLPYKRSNFKMQILQRTIWVLSQLFLWSKKLHFLRTLLKKTHIEHNTSIQANTTECLSALPLCVFSPCLFLFPFVGPVVDMRPSPSGCLFVL